MTTQTNSDGARRLMAALARMKPKPHEEMKVGKKSTPVSLNQKDAGAHSDRLAKLGLSEGDIVVVDWELRDGNPVRLGQRIVRTEMA